MNEIEVENYRNILVRLWVCKQLILMAGLCVSVGVLFSR
jgi:hypothetical protein